MSNKPKSRPPPAYQEYASDLLANRHYKQMTLGEKGLFHLLKNECWVNSWLPSNHDKLAKYLGESVDSIKAHLTDSVLYFFEVSGEQLRCPELDRYRCELNLRQQKLSEAASKGGKSTQSKNKAKLEAPLKAPLEPSPEAFVKPLSRAELSRAELSRNEKSKEELLDKEVTSVALFISNEEWIKDFE